MQELLDIVLHNRNLSHCGVLRPSGRSIDARTKGKDIIVFLVLKGVWVHVDKTFIVEEARPFKLGLSVALRLCAELVEAFLDNFAIINILKLSEFLSSLFILEDLLQLIPKENFNLPLLTFFKGDFIGVVELEDALVGSPVLDAGVVGGSALQLLLPEQVLVVESEEGEAFVLEGIGGVVHNQVAVVVMPAVPVVPVHSLLVVHNVAEHLAALARGLQLAQALDVLRLRVEACTQQQRPVSVLLPIVQHDFVLIRLELSHSRIHVDSGTRVDLCPN